MEAIIARFKGAFSEGITKQTYYAAGLIIGVVGLINPGFANWLVFGVLAAYFGYLFFRDPAKETEKQVALWSEAETKAKE